MPEPNFAQNCPGWRRLATVSNPPQIIEPQKPGSASARPNAQKTSVAWNVFKEEFIKRQQQSDVQRRLAFLGIAAPTKTHSLPHHQQIGRRSLRDSSPSWSTDRSPSRLTRDSSANRLLKSGFAAAEARIVRGFLLCYER
jgi:hypothetical protein